MEKEIIDDLRFRIDELQGQLDALRSRLDSALAAPADAAFAEPIDITLDDPFLADLSAISASGQPAAKNAPGQAAAPEGPGSLVNGPSVAQPAPVAPAAPEQPAAENAPGQAAAPEGPGSLVNGPSVAQPAPVATAASEQPAAVGAEVEVEPVAVEPEIVVEEDTVEEVKPVRKVTLDYQWTKDIQGGPVTNIISGISLNDRVLLINTLFKEDPLLFQSTIGAFNNMECLADACDYVQENFPDWNLSSDTVYRLMMAVRRKLRN